MLLRGFPASPRFERVRLVLRYKAIAFQEEPVRLVGGPIGGSIASSLRRTLEALEEPTLVDGDATITGAARIVHYLEDDSGHAERPLYPPAPQGARVRLVEQWVELALVPASQAVRWLVKTNLSRSFAQLAAAYGHGGADWLARVLRPAWREYVAWTAEGAPSWFGRDAARLNRLALCCDHLDGALHETGWLCGNAPGAADLGAFAALKPLEGLDGWETARGRKRIAAWMRGVEKQLGVAADAPADVIDVAEAQAFVDARRLSAKPKSA